MKPLVLPGMPPKSAPLDQRVNWLMDAVAEIARNSQVDALTIAQDFSTSNAASPPVRSLNVATATATDVAKVFAQFLIDLQRRGALSGTG